MQKRGDWFPLMAFEIVAAVLIIYLMMSYAKKTALGETTAEQFFVKDAAMVVDSLIAVPGNVVYNYQTANYSEDMELAIKDDLVDHNVWLTGKGISESYAFRPSSYAVSENTASIEKNKTNIIIFEKNKTQITIRKEEIT